MDDERSIVLEKEESGISCERDGRFQLFRPVFDGRSKILSGEENNKLLNRLFEILFFWVSLEVSINTVPASRYSIVS